MRLLPHGTGLLLAWLLSIVLFPACRQSGDVVEVNTAATGGDTLARELELTYLELDLPKRSYLVFRQELGLQDVPGFLAIEADSLRRKADRGSVEATGPMSSLFYAWDTQQGYADAAVALPVAVGTQLPPYVTITLDAQPALAVEFSGSYERLSAYHFALGQELRARGLNPTTPSIEEYIVGPDDTTDREAFRTRIIYPYQTAE